MWSFITCSKSPEKIVNWKRSWINLMAGTGIQFEFIVIEGADSICSGYRDAVKQANKKSELHIFAHDDMIAISPEFAPRLQGHMQKADMVGGCGADKCVGDKWFLAGTGHLYGQVLNFMHPQRVKQFNPETKVEEERDIPAHYSLAVFGIYKRLMLNCNQLDGFFIAARPGVAKWDSLTFNNFHHYDQDVSLQAAVDGYRVGVASDLGLLHYSSGGYGTPGWAKEASKFLAKWQRLLPSQPPQVPAFNTSGVIFGDPLNALYCMEKLVKNCDPQ